MEMLVSEDSASEFNKDFEDVLLKARHTNPWFTRENIYAAFGAWSLVRR